MKIFITGSTGMVGRNLTSHLALNRSYTILSPPRAELDLYNYADVCRYTRDHKPDVIIHCAGTVGGIQANIARPTDFLVSNLELGKNIVMAAKESGIPRLLNLGSSCMYPKNRDTLKEDDILTGELEPTNEGYAIAKIATAKLCEYISREFSGLSYKTIIPCNLYGPYDKFDPSSSHMIPSIIRKIHEASSTGASVEIWGDGSARREFMHVQDLVTFLEKAILNHESLPTYLNVGLGFDYSVLDYYKAASSVIGFNGEYHFDLTKPVGMKRKLLDVSRASAFGWKSGITLEEGIRNTYEFYLKGKI